jgi:2-polyprenyl-6-methoxyphenol hydroxylase-like FAD-dependent oxidoreductase
LSHKQYSQAIVIGAGIGGLISARVLSDFFDEVVVIERDELPDSMSSRKGIPQGFHNHSLLEGGRLVLEKFFPGFCDDLLAMGNLAINQTKDIKWFHHGVWKTREAVDRTMCLQSRWHLEGLLRQKVKSIKNISWLQKTITGLTVVDKKIHSVRTTDGEYTADLILEAGGRSSRLLEWLGAEGVDAPLVSKNRLELKYASQLYRRENSIADWQLLAVYPDAPKGNCSGVVFPIVHEEYGPCWMVSLIGRNGDYAGSTQDEFLALAKDLDQSDVYDFIKDLTPLLTRPAQVSFNESRWIHYERMKNRPTGILPIGDSYGHINPIYGQGVSISLMEADILYKSLAKSESLPKAESLYLKRVAKFFSMPWLLICCEDWRYPQVENRPPFIGVVNAYSRKLHRLSSVDKGVIRDVYDVLNFTKHPLVLYKPTTILKVLFQRVQNS